MTDTRDSAVVRSSMTRAAQPKILAGKTAVDARFKNPLTIHITIDNDSRAGDGDFGGASDQINPNRFNYVGTSPTVTKYEKMCSRRQGQDCLQSTFDWRGY